MIVNISWEDFHSRYYLDNIVYVKEHTNSFEFIVSMHNLIIRAVKEKQNNEEDIVFIERYMTDKKNIVKVLDFDGYVELEEPEVVNLEEEFKTEIE